MAIPPAGSFDRARLRRLRQSRGLTQDALGQLVRVSAYTVHEWETGKTRPSVENLRELARILSVQVNDLYRPPGSVPAYLKDLRVLAGLTQIELVKKLNHVVGSPAITQSKVSNWERAKSRIPAEYAARYAAVLGVTDAQLEDAARATWQDGRKAAPWTPLIDQRQREFKGIAAGSRELEFIYTLAGYLFALTELIVSRVGMHSENISVLTDEELHFWNLVAWYHYKLLKELRERAVAIINQESGIDEDVADRARSVIWTLDQHLTVSEDVLGLPREKLTMPYGMFGAPQGDPDNGGEHINMSAVRKG